MSASSALQMNLENKIAFKIFFLSFLQIKDSIVDAWSAVNVSDLQQVSQVSAVVASVADKRNELSIESQVRLVPDLTTTI